VLKKPLLPISVETNIQTLLESAGSKPSLIKAREQLTKRYRTSDGKTQAGFASSSEAIAYVAARFPATFAAIEAVLPRVPIQDIISVLDLGAGPGTGALAASLRWPSCTNFHLVEGDAFMSELSQKILKDVSGVHQTFSFQQSNIVNMSMQSPYDLVILSYVLNELSPKDQTQVLKEAWEKASKGVVVLVPGTPDGYEQLMILRDVLIREGAFIAAPCPHHEACPLGEGDWCHFSTRLPRSSIHRSIKAVSLPYEDEKFSYLVALRDPVPRPAARIIRKPLKRSGHVTLDLCTPEGLNRQTISKRDKAMYKAATHVAWGDEWFE
jgi:ribosomal protein RSM22 (predicted rRNA methylase)